MKRRDDLINKIKIKKNGDERMNGKNNPFRTVIVLAIIGIVVFGIIYAGISLTKDVGKSPQNITAESATDKLNSLYKDITVNNIQPRKGQVNLNPINIQDSLPDISKYPAQVENTTEDYIEIFSSVEKTGAGKDGWLLDTAKAFNDANIQVNGKTVSVRIRGIASGTGMDYIISGKYLPDAYTPSNELWGEILKAKGVNVTLAEKRLVGNVAGIVLSNQKNDELTKKYGSVNLKIITQAVANNELEMGYTNPFASAAGLNFLVSTLSAFDDKNPLSDKAVQGFEKFQANVPFVAYTTVQMRDAASSGVFDGFILEYNQFSNMDTKSQYTFTPYGVRHDSPLFEIGDLSPEKKEILDKFIEFAKSGKSQELATSDGFNGYNDYKPEIGNISGDIISQEQQLWKNKKDVNSNIDAVFVADISGSMEGLKLNKLKQSLLNGSQYISKDNSIGLVTFSSDVNINLPIAKLDLNQRSLFTGAVEDMNAGGSTAMFDAIIVGTKMLMDEKAKNPNAKLMLFVLTDGQTNTGHSLNDVEDVLKALKIPIYTIGYGSDADLQELQIVSNINEATSLNADTEDVVYQLGNLFNAEI
jgi:Ca-activated chloride channel family protein